MHHERLANEFVLRLAKRALWIIAPVLREEEHHDAFEEFARAFHEELVQYELDQKRMIARLKGRPSTE